MTTPKHSEHNEEGLSKSLSAALSDGIFAISMTLLILDIKIPGMLIHSSDLTKILFDLWPKFLAYFASFVTLGVFWIAHHGFAHFLKRTDRTYLWLNLIFLMFAALVPFSTSLLGDHSQDRVAVIFYGCNFIALGVSLYAQWWYSTSGHRLVGKDVEPELVHRGKMRIVRGFILYVTAVLIALINPVYSLFLFVLFPFLYILPSHFDRHWTHSHN